MVKYSGGSLNFELIATDASKDLIRCLWAILTPNECARLLRSWWFWRRPAQTPPPGQWRTWVLLGGRGAGKTRAGAEWIREQVEWGGRRRIALIGPTFHDVREVMIEGPSGLRALSGRAPTWEAVRRRLVWPNGAEAHALSASDPESLRGPQFDAAWADELCAWDKPEETWALLSLGLRLGETPQAVVTTTPKPLRAFRRLLDLGSTIVTRASTRANAAFLAPGFVEAVEQRWGGTSYGRQGAVSLVLRCLCLRAFWPAGEAIRDAASKVQAAPVPPGGHPASRLALFSIYAELSRRRRNARRAGNCGLVRDDPLLDSEVRSSDRAQFATAQNYTVAALAP
jgi:hypothetical protein